MSQNILLTSKYDMFPDNYNELKGVFRVGKLYRSLWYWATYRSSETVHFADIDELLVCTDVNFREISFLRENAEIVKLSFATNYVQGFTSWGNSGVSIIELDRPDMGGKVRAVYRLKLLSGVLAAVDADE